MKKKKYDLFDWVMNTLKALRGKYLDTQLFKDRNFLWVSHIFGCIDKFSKCLQSSCLQSCFAWVF